MYAAQLFGAVPGGDQALSALHMNPYAPRGLAQDIIEGAAGMRYLPPR